MLRESSSNSFYVFNKTLMKREVGGEADKEREKNREKEERQRIKNGAVEEERNLAARAAS